MEGRDRKLLGPVRHQGGHIKPVREACGHRINQVQSFVVDDIQSGVRCDTARDVFRRPKRVPVKIIYKLGELRNPLRLRL